MIQRLSVIAALGVILGCSSGPVESVAPVPAPDAFEGAWRSVTPSLEFIRLTVQSKSSEKGAWAARLTFSGVMWEGSGRIDGDSLVADMTIPGVTMSSGVLVAHVRDPETLAVQFRPSAAGALALTVVREK